MVRNKLHVRCFYHAKNHNTSSKPLASVHNNNHKTLCCDCCFGRVLRFADFATSLHWIKWFFVFFPCWTHASFVNNIHQQSKCSLRKFVVAVSPRRIWLFLVSFFKKKPYFGDYIMLIIRMHFPTFSYRIIDIHPSLICIIVLIFFFSGWWIFSNSAAWFVANEYVVNDLQSALDGICFEWPSHSPSLSAKTALAIYNTKFSWYKISLPCFPKKSASGTSPQYWLRLISLDAAFWNANDDDDEEEDRSTKIRYWRQKWYMTVSLDKAYMVLENVLPNTTRFRATRHVR